MLLLAVAVAAPVRADDGPSAETLKQLKAATVFIKVTLNGEHGSGSGFVVKADAQAVYVVTNHHVIAPDGSKKPTLMAVFGSGTKEEQVAPAVVVADDTRRDLAVVKIVNLKTPPKPLEIAEAKPTETMPVLICGFPLGEALATGKGNPAITVNKGSVSSIRLKDNGDIATVQINGDITPGNSGGPVVDTQGRLVGVAQATIATRAIGFAIPAQDLTGLLQGRLLDHYFVTKPNGTDRVDVRVELAVFDPFERLKGVNFYYRKGESNGDKKLANLPGVVKVNLQRDTTQVVGKFTLDVPSKSEVPVTFQAVYTDGEGKTFITNPRMRKFGSTPPPPVVATRPPPEMPDRPLPPTNPGGSLEKVTQANFDKVQVGMAEGEVHKLLGPPTRISKFGNGFIHTWQDASTVVTIRMRNGRVATKQGLGLKGEGGAPPPPPGPPAPGGKLADRVTQARFDAIQNGMTVAQVHKALGAPTRVGKLGDVDLHTWQDATVVATVHFRDGKVVLKQAAGLK
jgi:hypothetical protein